MANWSNSRRGFTMIELLVVIGIIGVLAGIMFASFGGATESARAAKCLANMRTLAVAANSYALAAGHYPAAGSVELMNRGEDGTLGYREQRGWISWLSQGKYDDGNGNAVSSSHQSNMHFPFYGTGKLEDREYAITNGAIWQSCSRNASLYRCPEHELYRRNHGKSKPYFSYVMNARFGWDYRKGQPIAASYVGPDYGALAHPDKTLLFAELPTVATVSEGAGEEDAKDGNDLASDSVLQYLDLTSSTGARGAYASPEGEAEEIGFVHSSGKRGRLAHVVFADGHTETLQQRFGNVDAKTLTAYLCRGWDVSLGNAGWQLSQDADSAE